MKRLQKRGYNLSLLKEAVKMLAEGKPLPAKMRDHPLVGDYAGGAGSLPVYDRRAAGCRECHISPDWLLVYEIWQEELILYLMRTGTHSDLF